MITKENEAIVEAIKKYIDEHAQVGETGLDWDKIAWIDTLDRLVHCLHIAPQSYKYCSDEDPTDVTVECAGCGWWGSNKLLDGGGQIADTGDYGDSYCPVCGGTDFEDKHTLEEQIKIGLSEVAQIRAGEIKAPSLDEIFETAFTEAELMTLKRRFSGFKLMDEGKELYSSTNGGFGSISIRKEGDKIIHYSHVPSDWDMDTGKVDGYSTSKVEYNTAEDCISAKNGKDLIDK